MKLSELVSELTHALASSGDMPVELQERDTTCHSEVHAVVEDRGSVGDYKPVLKLRSWPY